MSYVLGINAFHPDASACLLKDGNILFAIAEERLGSREKHKSGFPEESIKACLSYAKISPHEIDEISVARSSRANITAKLKFVLRNPITTISRSRKYDREGPYHKLIELGLINLGFDLTKTSLHSVEHHLAHIASSYYCSATSDKTLAVSYDGSGDFVSVAIAECEGNTINILRKGYFPNSIGFFYTAICQYIGFKKFGEEYKVMGLAPYGTDRYTDQLSKYLNVNQKGIPKLKGKFLNVKKILDVDISQLTNQLPNFLHADTVKALPPIKGDSIQGYPRVAVDLAKSCQVVFENTVLDMLEKAGVRNYRNLVTAGGCALNGVTNAKIRLKFDLDKVFIQPAASDDGLCIGAAKYTFHRKKPFIPKEPFSPYLGNQYNNDDMLSALNSYGKELTYTTLSDGEIYELTIDKLTDGQVIGWFQGRSEWGPRALGNRSIIADPSFPNIKDIINAKIKKRESFRPFAPSVLEADVEKLFKQRVDSPYMMHVVEFKDEYKKMYPSVVHVDGTGRLQTVTEKLNPRYFKLLSEMKKKTGIGIILNTSFNENEPIVERPEHALDVLVRTDLDAVVLGNYFVTRNISRV